MVCWWILHQGRVPEMYLDVLASRLGMHDASDEALRVGSTAIR